MSALTNKHVLTIDTLHPTTRQKYKYVMHLYTSIKHTHSTRDHAVTRASKHLYLAVLPRQTSISKNNKKYFI